ncbi:MAG: hypothetical protein H6744_12680 [Deltaproteobacteria bacterium]|nr:hypothetical protein [Deltaproteobacteria bacterium]MCB9787528.1 hypothetical protein [Deltaproteobacteria bacterium]
MIVQVSRFIAIASVMGWALGCGGEDGGADTGPDTSTTADASDTTDGSAAVDGDGGSAPGPDASPDATTDAEVGCATGAPCDDGDPCTTDDVCDAAGACAGTAISCDDGLTCTADACKEGACTHTLGGGYCLREGDTPVCVSSLASPPDNSCVFCDLSAGSPAWKPFADGAPCSDGDACTKGDVCELGACITTSAVQCPNTNPCVSSTCEPSVGCVDSPLDVPCDDGDPCTVGDLCAAGACTAGAGELDCDDADPCTLDGCTPEVGCWHVPDTKCDDGEACTVDTCQPDGSCTNEPFSGPCEDGDLCTSGEVCADGVCAGGVPVSCDDDEECTADGCDPATGCTHFYVGGACDDGYSCSIEDTCVAGLCVGAKQGCGLCQTPVTDKALKVISLLMAGDANPGSGLDVDGDPLTCAPEPCGGGVDNALSVIAALMNEPLNEALASAAVLYVVDLDKATLDGQEFPMAVLDSELTLQSQFSGCDFQSETCSYTPTQFSYGPSCEPYFGLPNATIVNGELRAGGKGYVMTMALALGGGVFIALTIVDAQVRGVVKLGGDGTQIVGLTGVIGGATPKKQLISTIAALPSSVLPVDSATVISLLDLIVETDVDLDGDGENDGSSLAIRFDTIPAVLE